MVPELLKPELETILAWSEDSDLLNLDELFKMPRLLMVFEPACWATDVTSSLLTDFMDLDDGI